MALEKVQTHGRSSAARSEERRESGERPSCEPLLSTQFARILWCALYLDPNGVISPSFARTLGRAGAEEAARPTFASPCVDEIRYCLLKRDVRLWEGRYWEQAVSCGGVEERSAVPPRTPIARLGCRKWRLKAEKATPDPRFSINEQVPGGSDPGEIVLRYSEGFVALSRRQCAVKKIRVCTRCFSYWL